MAVPRTIHQVWVGDEMPVGISANCDAMRKMNHDMAYTLHGNEVLERYRDDPYVRHLIGSGAKMAFVVDRIRVLLLREFGGIYVDCDARPIQPFSKLKFWDDPKVDFVAAMRDPYRPAVALHRGVSLVDNSVFASAKNGRIANRLCSLYNSKAPRRDGHDHGCEVMANTAEDVVWLNFRYIYALQRYAETIILHDDANLGSWVDKKEPAILTR